MRAAASGVVRREEWLLLARIEFLWSQIRDSLWLVPALLTLASLGLAVITITIDETLLAEASTAGFWLFGGSAVGARELLSAIASGVITVAGVVFSVTVVALQLASSQFSPRILRSYMTDQPAQLTLGIFIATFTYSLVVLRSVRVQTETTQGFVPALSVSLAMALALLSIGFLIFFVDHIARAIQASNIIALAGKEARQQAEQLFWLFGWHRIMVS